MKKIIFSLVALVASMSMNAQVMKVMKNGEVVATYEGADYEYVFEEARVSTTGTAKRTGDIDVPWVQLWENGPKFAAYNVGAANNKAEDFGGYYSWGMSIDRDKASEWNKGSEILAGNNDTAIKLWGSNWRMPTKAELEALLDNCEVTWTKVNGVSGCQCTGKGTYSANSIFFPAPGASDQGTIVGKGESGYYWASDPGDNEYLAPNLYFCSYKGKLQDLFVSPGLRYMGQAVRAVLAE
ncbi:MAG: hypothetical protein KBT39_13515 [Bacteroidales bacterium]|nr:hypothetical protein [Bacteroidales bacterium]